MKKVLFVAAFLVGMTAMAQDGKVKSSEIRTNKMSTELNLTAEQQSKIKEIKSRMLQDKSARLEVRKANRAQYQNEIRSVLTADQLARVDARKASKAQLLEKKKAKFAK